MSTEFNQAIASIKKLTANERALMAHCLIASLETQQDLCVDEEWPDLAAMRHLQLESGAVKGLSWDEIKKRVTDGNQHIYLTFTS